MTAAEWEAAYVDLERQLIEKTNALHVAHDTIGRMVRPEKEQIMARAPRSTPPDIKADVQDALRQMEGVTVTDLPADPGPWDNQPQGEAAEQARTGIPEPITEPAQSDRVVAALLKHLAALNSKARQVGAGRDDLFIAESFRELAEAIIEERRVR